MRDRMVSVWEVLHDGAGSGPAADGTFVSRFSSQADADAFARCSTVYGRPCRVPVEPSHVPVRLAVRWGLR